jgi:PAS domain S-box-containing protein
MGKIDKRRRRTPVDYPSTSKIELNSGEEASEYAQNIIDTIREPLIALNHDLRVVKASRSFYEFFRVTPSETVGTLIYDLGNHQWNIPKLRELLETILPDKTSFDNYEVEHSFATIGKRIMLLNARQIQRADGKERIILLAIEDITERKKKEEEIQNLNQELEQRTKELESFSYSVSHDLRSPLRAIDGFSNILLEDYSTVLDEEGKRLFNVIRENTRKMGHLIDDLLAFSRIGRRELYKSEIDFKAMVYSVFNEITSDQEREKISFIVDDLPLLKGDATMIKQLWYNLISNAIKFSSKRENSKIEIGIMHEKENNIYFIRDNGVGFDMKYYGKLFGVFQRLHSEAEYKGNGVGLAIVNSIVTRHGGKIWAESELNIGATFYFRLQGGSNREQ